jgi:hypothetical protein
MSAAEPANLQAVFARGHRESDSDPFVVSIGVVSIA